MKKTKFYLIKKVFPERVLDFLRIVYNPFKYNYQPPNDCFLVKNIDQLVFNQVNNGCFNRYDLVVIYLAIEQYYKKNQVGFALYEKMQKKRMKYRNDFDNRDFNVERFIAEILLNIEKKGYDYRHSITLDINQQLCDGAHRLSAAIYFNLPVLSVTILRSKSNIFYGIDWFKSNHFTSDELNLILLKKNEIFLKLGLSN